jgi:galactonate dehydratase
MYRFSHFPGAAIMGALSALDIALWDIAGKHFGVPVYQLLGGQAREKARVYYHVFGDTRDQLVKGVEEAKAMGFTAVGHLTPFLDEKRDVPYFRTHAHKVADAIDAVRQYRDVVGYDVDLCIEIHRRLTPAEAVQLGLGIEPYHPLFFEDPVMPNNFDEMAYVADKINESMIHHVIQSAIESLHTRTGVSGARHRLNCLRLLTNLPLPPPKMDCHRMGLAV